MPDEEHSSANDLSWLMEVGLALMGISSRGSKVTFSDVADDESLAKAGSVLESYEDAEATDVDKQSSDSEEGLV